MSLKISEAKATIVVNAVYKQGLTIFEVVSDILSYCVLDVFAEICLYRTIKWMFIDNVKINIREMKFDDITVTCQSKSPNNPIIIATA